MDAQSDGWHREIKVQLSESAEIKRALLGAEHVQTIVAITREIIECYERGGKVILFGNGGSAADAQHISGELASKFQIEREPLQAIALTTNSSIMTAVSNDYDYDHVFARQVEAWAGTGDVVIGLSTSGTSPSVLLGIEAAKLRGALTIGLTGAKGDALADAADLCLKVPSTSTPRIQEAHITIGHVICGLVEKALFE